MNNLPLFSLVRGDVRVYVQVPPFSSLAEGARSNAR